MISDIEAPQIGSPGQTSLMDKISSPHDSAPTRLDHRADDGLLDQESHSARFVLWLFLRSGWFPAALSSVLVPAVWGFYGVSISDIVRFGLYVVLCLALPGVLLIRALYGGSRTLAEEVALGTTLAYAIEVAAYIAAQALSAALLVLVWPICTYVAFVAVPRLRRHWTGTPHARPPIWWSWFLALITAFLVGWSGYSFFKLNALTWPGAGTSFFDMPYHLALIGELKHHMPPTVPTVAGEPLLYHWFVYTHFAAASWITGIEPLVLLYRLAMLPMLAAFVVLIGMIGQRVTGSRPGAGLAVAGTVFVAIPSLYLNANGLLIWSGTQPMGWGSPTQMFGALLFAAVVLLLVELLEHRHRAGGWLLLGIFLAVVMGAKATHLPMLMVGLLVVAAVELATGRRPWPALAALGMATACFVYAQFVLFGGARQGMVISPLSFAARTWQALSGLGSQVEPPLISLLGVALTYILCWLVTWCGILGLGSRPRVLTRPAVVLMLGIGAAGFGAVLLLGSTYLNEGYFIQAAYPYLAILAAFGFVVLARREKPSHWAAAAGVGAGIVIAYLIRVLCAVEVPLIPGQPEIVLFLPYVVLLAVVIVAAVLVIVTRRRMRTVTLLVSLVAAIGSPAAWLARIFPLGHGQAGKMTHAAPAQVPKGALAAGRWLRAHSRPDDLVATNAHCLWGRESPCDSRHFWVAALSERRVLVEGWSYTSTNMDRWRPGLAVLQLPFWDDERIRSNDMAFRQPSETAIRRLRGDYGVRWLVLERHHRGRNSGLDPKIEDFAQLRYRAGDYAIYRVPDLIPGYATSNITSTQ